MINKLIQKAKQNPHIAIPVGLGVAALLAFVVYKFTKRKTLTSTNSLTTNIDLSKIRDQRTKDNIMLLHPTIRQKAVDFVLDCYKNGIDIIITSSLRTFAEQTALYNQGRTTPGIIVTNAQAGQSWHNFGQAFDCLDKSKGYEKTNWNMVGQLGKQHGFAWGGDWTGFLDRPHLEYSFGMSITQAYQKYQSGNTANGYIIV